ncbi:ABC transporter permease [Sinorhizobium alkalisoli]|uniref:ABC transporter permease n=1 Tax=Sinorhizobium alkalisoli TaxID=1752398 RepID=UPI00124EF99E|nr:ABC transporter permease [Sinorhizobium alkalisoli]
MNIVFQHVRVTGALMVREMSTRYGNKPGGYAWALIDPVAHVLLLTLIFQTISKVPALGSSFSLFFASGYLPYSFYQSMAAFTSGAIKANRNLLNYPVVSPFDAVVSRYFVQMLTSALVGCIVMATVILHDGVSLHADLRGVVSAFFLATFLGFGMGLINSVLFARSPLYEQVYGVITRPLFMLSGVFFLTDSIPHPYRDMLLYNPIAQVIMAFRKSIYPEYRAFGLDMFYIVIVAVMLISVGLMLFTTSGRAIREDRL